MPDRLNLVAVQAKPTLTDYRDHAAFHDKIASLMAAAAREADLSLPTLVAFPELVGMYLAFVPHYWDDLAGESNLEAAATKIVMKNILFVPEEARTSPEAAARHLLFLQHAVETEAAYTATFSSLAREFGVYLAAGSIALPSIEQEPSKGGRHIADPAHIDNTAYLFSPRGVCLNRVPKANLVPGFEERVFDPATPSALVPADTAVGRIGTLVCFDGFHETLVERYDAQGVQIMLKPSYNMHPWNTPWPFDETKLEGENWLNTGCPSIIQGRENIRYGVNAMMVGAVFEDTAAEGLSSISRNTGRPGASWEDGVLAMAAAPTAEEIIVATVDAPTA
ncbi:MAG TPA: carbon-nitrogen hydrolase family protein [Dehalococcoidia bacterium]|nr:carbon-nitrogen hydrolase family protein [Dehalococcoidia bacterium]